ncbi:hypothetical protein DFA_04087 [Cavenderia fasciculata]|uniref:Ankyrin repeat-containing protein n=1 Tax=Cavenderia fasciculata TaxID=261658 RepID=F4Q192_CACFS|nr:uncharacterized protein DFA_04087 [Cavenderia fasciculata]EGG18593.1 hypothetical protein DFA_04087 [Cavenderia fasciculata]|eukprot:XP_004366497.1 hypothetical protein DFA_04087 [Cavenderia fasciculata]
MTTTTIITILNVLYIKHTIFKHVEEISKRASQEVASMISLKGRDIVKLPYLQMISKFGMPWDYIKHYLPPTIGSTDKDNDVLLKRRVQAISKYCSHRNATLSTLVQLLKWSGPKFNPQPEQVDITTIIMNGNKDILMLLLKQCPHLDYSGANQAASLYGHVSILEMLRDSQPKGDFLPTTYGEASLADACGKGYLDVVIYLHNTYGDKINGTENAFEYAVSNSHLDIVKFLHFNRSEPCSRKAIISSAMSGSVELVKFLHETQTGGWSTEVMDQAASYGHLEILKFLHEHRSEGCTTMAMDMAAHCGHFSVVEWLNHNRSEGCTEDAMDMTNSFEIVQFLHNHRSEGCTTHAMDIAAAAGNLQTVSFLHSNRTEGCTTKAMDEAIRYSHIDVVKFLYENRSEGCSMNKIFSIACLRDDISLEMIRYLNETIKAVPNGKEVYCGAVNNRVDVIQYLLEQYPNVDWDFGGILSLLVSFGCLETLKFFQDNLPHALSCKHNIFDKACKHSSTVDMIRFLHENNYTQWCSTDAMDQASASGNLEIVEFLHFNRTEGCTTRAMDRAALNGHLKVVKFLHENRTEGCKYFLGIFTQDSTVPLCFDTAHYMLSNKLVSKDMILKDCIHPDNYEIIQLVDQFLLSDNSPYL